MWLFQEQTPVVLGKTGTVFLLIFSAVSALLNIWQQYKVRAAERLLGALQTAESALHTTETEMNVYRSRCERQTAELAEANRKIGELNAKTDLSAVLQMLSETIALTRESVDLSRKFDRENSQLNASLARTLEKHGESDRQIFGEIRDSLANLTHATKELSADIQEHRQDTARMVSDVMKAIEGTPR